jgi:hypothetical protein
MTIYRYKYPAVLSTIFVLGPSDAQYIAALASRDLQLKNPPLPRLPSCTTSAAVCPLTRLPFRAFCNILQAASVTASCVKTRGTRYSTPYSTPLVCERLYVASSSE